jgi:hypothetical protein
MSVMFDEPDLSGSVHARGVDGIGKFRLKGKLIVDDNETRCRLYLCKTYTVSYLAALPKWRYEGILSAGELTGLWGSVETAEGDDFRTSLLSQEDAPGSFRMERMTIDVWKYVQSIKSKSHPWKMSLRSSWSSIRERRSLRIRFISYFIFQQVWNNGWLEHLSIPSSYWMNDYNDWTDILNRLDPNFIRFFYSLASHIARRTIFQSVPFRLLVLC